MKRGATPKLNAFQKLPADTQKALLEKIAAGKNLKEHTDYVQTIGLTMAQLYKWNARGYLAQGAAPLANPA